MTLVAGVDSSTQSCKVVVRDVESGALVRSGSAPHPAGTEVDPEKWWTALLSALDAAGGLADVDALAIAGQQHGMVCLDQEGRVVRPALLWNDTRSAQAAEQLVDELGSGDADRGARAWAEAVGTVPVASLTVAKLRWLADAEPDLAARVAAVALPHDWLTWRLAGAQGLDALVTDRSEASGTGYFDAATDSYRRDLLSLALRRDAAEVVVPRVLAPQQAAGHGFRALDLAHVVLGPGCGDNAGAALGLALTPGRTSLSLGTSGVVAVVADVPFRDPSGQVAGFADATGHHLGLAVTLNAARVLDAAATVLGVGHDELARLALRAPRGADGLVLVPYLDGERTPNLPDASGFLVGMTTRSLTRENYARAAVEGLLCLMADALSAVQRLGVDVDDVVLVGGAARSPAVQAVAPEVLGVPVEVPATSEHVADGAARQAAWVLTGAAAPPAWSTGVSRTVSGNPRPELLARYRDVARRAFPPVGGG